MSSLMKRVSSNYFFYGKNKARRLSSMQGLSAALTCRLHRWSILCQRGNEIGEFAGKRSHVDVWKAYNGDFTSTRQGAAASHNQARRLRLAAAVGNRKRPSSRRPSPTVFCIITSNHPTFCPGDQKKAPVRAGAEKKNKSCSPYWT